MPATEIETLVIRAVRERLNLSEEIDDRSLITTHVVRVEVWPEELVIQLAEAPGAHGQKGVDGSVRVSWQKTMSTRRREILLPEGVSPQHARPIRSETRATLVASIARGRHWLDELIADATATPASIAKRERCSVRKVNMTISLAFLAPDLVKAAIDGRLPHGMGVLASPTCPPNGASNTKFSAFPSSSRIRTSLCLALSLLPGNGILRPETKVPKFPSGADVATHRDPAPARKPVNSAVFAKSR